MNKPYNITLGAAASTKIAAERNLKSAAAWVTGTAEAQGVIRKNAGHYYMAIGAGTTGATAPVHMAGIVSDGTVSWLYVPEGHRDGVVVQNRDTAIDVDLALGWAAETGKGILAKASGGGYSAPDGYQGAIYAYPASGTPVMSVQEL